MCQFESRRGAGLQPIGLTLCALMSDAPAPRSRLWSFDRKTERAQVDQHVRADASRLICYAVVDAVLEIRGGGDVVKPEHVAAFVRAAEATHGFVFGLGGKRLIQCSHFSALAADALRALSQHRRWRPRFNLACVIGYGPPDALALELLATGMSDADGRVAARAAAACDELREVDGVLQLLDERLAVETRREVIESLEFTSGLMRTPEVREGRQLVREYRGAKFIRDAPRGRAAGT